MKNYLTMSLIICFLLGSILDFGAGLKASQLNAMQTSQVTGKVSDANTGELLPGVSILIKGTTSGTITDIDGNYSISVSAGSTLVFSFMGYLEKEIQVTNETVINVALEPDVKQLDEVIVTGYGVQKKSDVTGSIASVSGEKIAETPMPAVDQALQGLAAGVNVIPESGRPGADAVIQIRGISSINGIDPLIIVDGVPGVLANVSPSDIQSIEVLKDASSAAIYGDDAGNGVIIITTKKGTPGKIKTTVNFYQGIETPVNKIELMSTEQWLSVVDEKFASPNAVTSRPDTMPNYDWQDIIFQPALTQNYDVSSTGGNDVSTYLVSASYNNQEGIVRASNYDRITLRVNSEHKISKRLTFDEKVNFVNTRNFGIPEGLWSQYYDGPIRQALIMPPNTPDYDPNISNYTPEGKIKNPNGLPWGNSIYGRDNPLAKLDMSNRVQKNSNFNINAGLKIDIIKGLSFTSRFAGNMDFWDTKEFRNAYQNTIYDFRNEEEVDLVVTMGRGFSQNLQQLLNYDFSIADAHNFAILIGTEAIRNWDYDYNGQRAFNANTPEYMQYYTQAILDTSLDTDHLIKGGGHEERALAQFGRLNYDYKGKYLLTANIRRSGRSSFGPDMRFGIFPAFSLGWKFSEEGFMKNQSLISFGKIRFGYGQAGTYARSGYPYLSIVRYPNTFAYPFDNAVSSAGAAPVQIANPEIHWETIHMSNFGIDLTMLDNRISFTAEYYQKVNEDMLMLKEVPYIVGTFQLDNGGLDQDRTSPEVNIGSIKNSGLEFIVGYKEQRGDLKYNVDFNLSTLKNEVLSLATDSMTAGGVHNVNPINLTRVGGAVAEFYGYETNGIFTREDCEVDANGEYVKNAKGEYIVINQPYTLNDKNEKVYAQKGAQPGDVRYVDKNGDGKVLTPQDKTYLGSPLPKLIFGLSFKVEYKGLDFSAQLNGTWGNKIFNGTKQYLYYYQDLTNRHVDFAKRYIDEDIIKLDPVTGKEVVVVKANRDTDIPANEPDNYVYPSDFFIEDGSYLRLRNMTLGYTLPQNWTQIINIEMLRIYVGARNMKTWTKYTGINPEVGDTGLLDMGIDDGIYPVTKMLYWGANLTF